MLSQYYIIVSWCFCGIGQSWREGAAASLASVTKSHSGSGAACWPHFRMVISNPVWCCCHLEPLCCPTGWAGSQTCQQTTLSSLCTSEIPLLAHKSRQMCMEELALQEEFNRGISAAVAACSAGAWRRCGCGQQAPCPGSRTLRGSLGSWVLEPSALGAEGGSAALKVRFRVSVKQPCQSFSYPKSSLLEWFALEVQSQMSRHA